MVRSPGETTAASPPTLGTSGAEGAGSASTQTSLDQQRLDLELYKLKLDYRKFIWGSVIVAIAIATIPPSFQLATALLEYVKTTHEETAKAEEFHDGYVKDFMNNAVNQDIELRIRFAEYFSHVSGSTYKNGWIEYYNNLIKQRNEIRNEIEQNERNWLATIGGIADRDISLDEIARRLHWYYNEVGYVEKDRSLQKDRRKIDTASTPNPLAAEPLTYGIVLQAVPQAPPQMQEPLKELINTLTNAQFSNENLYFIMAIILDETAGLQKFSEDFNYSAARLMQVWPQKFPNLDVANRYAHKPQDIANLIYANILGNGNEASGDGWKFRGRGYLGLSGKSNYADVSKLLGIDIVETPDRIIPTNDPVTSAKAAVAVLQRALPNGEDRLRFSDFVRKLEGPILINLASKQVWLDTLLKYNSSSSVGAQ